MTSKIPQRAFLNIHDIEKYYLDNIARYGVKAPRTMGYHSGPIDDRLIINILPQEVPSAYSVLDVGCGLGQLIPILESRFPAAQLTRLVGLDLVDDFVSHCVEEFQQHNFFTANFLEWKSPEQFDLVLAAGVLVTRISDFESYLHKFVEKMILHSKGWVGFNVVASCGPGYTAKHLATISDEKLSSLLEKFTEMNWMVQKKEVFPGSEDIFVCGRKVGWR